MWESAYTMTPPHLDGIVDEVWQTAKPLTVVVREALGGDHPRSVVLRALHTGDTLFVLVQWPDKTKSALRDPYVWNATKHLYERPTKPDDQFAIEFPMEGDFEVRMLTLAHRYVADVWHWKAGRGNPLGWVDDKRHFISQEPIPGAAQYSMGGHGNVYIARPLDEGTPSYRVKPKPETFQGDLVDSFEHREPTGSLSDVRGKAIHDGKMWTLEMSRKLNTGHADDAVIDPGRDNICAIAILDDELYWEHSVSPLIAIRFLGDATGKVSAHGKDTSAVRQWDFEDTSVNSLPAYIDSPQGSWIIQALPDAPSGSKTMVQVTKSPRTFFNLAVIKDAKFRDLRLTVKFRALSGVVDQGGGLVWRLQGPDNYYIARANPLENNFRVYKMVGGRREMLASADVPAEPQKWHTLSITMRGNNIVCELDSNKYLEAHDDTFKDAGLVGMWTKADANTAFDLLRVESYDD